MKIATMAANLLVRMFGVEFADHRCIDVSPDVHLMRVLGRLGIVGADDDREAAIYKAREISAEFPGIIDPFCWEIGRNYCRPAESKMLCRECPLTNFCPKSKFLEIKI